MESVAKKINIKGHFCGLSADPSERRFLHSPCDIEGHKGTDGEFYVLDFARVFPPTAEPGVKNSFLYKLFRCAYLRNTLTFL